MGQKHSKRKPEEEVYMKIGCVAAKNDDMTADEGGAVGGRSPNRLPNPRQSEEIPYDELSAMGQEDYATMDRETLGKSSANAVVCAAIDFGTTYTGFAFSYKAKPDEIVTHYWPEGTIKTPTIILIDVQTEKICYFGDTAKRKYQEFIQAGQHKEWYFFERFKMALFTQGTTHLSKDMEIEDILGRKMLAINIFSLAINHMKLIVIATINDAKRNHVQVKYEKEIRWILTVPAIWNDFSKWFMREAANKAEISSEMLTLALEPETASLNCRKELGLTKLCPGKKYMVLDIGGGTVDVTVHEVNFNKTLTELHQPRGGAFGGTLVDHEFINILLNIFGKAKIHRFKEDHMKAYWELMADFEMKKRKFSGKGKLTLRFPYHLLGLTIEEIHTKLREINMDDEITFVQDKIRLKEVLARRIFDVAVREITDTVDHLLEQVGGISYIVMVGGFSESPYLQSVMRDRFKKKVLIPKEPSGAVLKGAVQYGHETKGIASRVCKFTYGIAQLKHFKNEVYPEERKVTIDGMDYCDNVFNTHIKIGTRVTIDSEDHAKEQEYFPPTKDVRHAVLEVYASTKTNPQFTDEEGCQLVGLIKVDIDPKGDIQSKIMVKMMFGGTELKIQIRDLKNNKITNAAVDFIG